MTKRVTRGAADAGMKRAGPNEERQSPSRSTNCLRGTEHGRVTLSPVHDCFSSSAGRLQLQ